jgi:nitroreductase
MSVRAEKPLSQVVRERRATPQFESTPIPEQDLRTILQAGIESPSGYNLQPWRFVVVRDPENRRRVRDAAFGQPKVEQAPVIIACCGDPEAYRKDLEAVIEIGKQHGFTNEQQNEQMRQGVHALLDNPGPAGAVRPDRAIWINRQVMIAFSTMMWMAEAMGYDTAPMEGFLEDKVRQTLGIPDTVRVVALLGVGHRKGADKPYGGRLPMTKLVFAERWGQPIKLEEEKAA